MKSMDPQPPPPTPPPSDFQPPVPPQPPVEVAAAGSTLYATAPGSTLPGLGGFRYILKRKIMKMVGSDFYIYDEGMNLVLFVNQKGWRLKEDIRIYTDQSKTNEVMAITARKVIDFSASYDVFDKATGQRIGVLKRKGWSSIVRDEWHICDSNEQQIGVLIEDSAFLAMMRRLLTNLIPQNYDLLHGKERHVDMKQNFNPFSYHLNITIEKQGIFDTRLVLASAVMLAAVERRQASFG